MLNPSPHRFSWLSSIIGVGLPEEALHDAEAAWLAAAEAAGVGEKELVQRIAAAFRLPVADLTGDLPLDGNLIPAELARRYMAFPLAQDARTLDVATCDPGNADLAQQLEFAVGRHVMIHVAPPQAVLSALAVMAPQDFNLDAEWTGGVESGDDGAEDEETERQLKLSAENPALLDVLITRGIALGASDIHVQSSGRAGTVRYRVDGVLQAGPQLSLDGLAAVLGRAKAVGGMDPSVRIRPQDGRGVMRVEGRTYDLRFSALPSSGSESLVVRILAAGGLLRFDTYGADDDSMARMRRGFLDQTAGIFIVTGPTGSGKTTLLYSLLRELNDGRRDIHTVEDPVEIQMEGLAQVQINKKAGLTFEAAIRSLLRQDPDVILVSETRDAVTARAVTDAAMTGHLVATTLHTIDAATALLRLGDLGVDPRELAQALTGISAQRLLRSLCPHCREPVTDAATPHEEWFAELAGGLPRYRGVGCSRCGGSAYAGRFPAVEVLLTDNDVVAAFMAGASHAELRRTAQRGGMRTMAEIVVDRALQGETDVTEIRRVMGSDLMTPDALGRPASSATGPTPAVARSHTVAEGPRYDEARLTPADVLLISEDSRTRVVVEDGLRRAGLTHHAEADVPSAAVWAEIHGPRLVMLDVQHEGDGAVLLLRQAADAFLSAGMAVSVMVLAPSDDRPLERVLLEHGMVDYLRSPLTPEHVGLLADQVLRRSEVLRHPWSFAPAVG